MSELNVFERCQNHIDHQNRIGKLESNTEELYNKVNCVDKFTAKMEVILENLSKLPSAIESLEKSMVAMQGEIKQSNEKIGLLEKRFDGLDKQIDTIDNKDKVSILDWLKTHWFEIAIAVGVLANFIKIK